MRFYVILILALILSACRKDDVPQELPDLFSGTYHCQVHTYSWIMGGPSSSNDYEADIDVAFYNDSVRIEEYNWKESALNVKEDTAIWVNYGSAYNLNVKFTSDSLFYSQSSGGLGGQSGVSFSGNKL